VKLVITVVKYVPQAWLNFRRKSTTGWSIAQIILDFAGGITSMLQLVIDSSLQNDWSGIIGNPVKFGLALVSMSFDIVFITQHYLLYNSQPDIGVHSPRKDTIRQDRGERRPLLDSGTGDRNV
jgi:cystinosin